MEALVIYLTFLCFNFSIFNMRIIILLFWIVKKIKIGNGKTSESYLVAYIPQILIFPISAKANPFINYSKSKI